MTLYLMKTKTIMIKLSKTQKTRVEAFKKNINIATLMMKNNEEIADIVSFINREFLLIKNLKKTIETSKSEKATDTAEKALERYQCFTFCNY